MKVIQCPDYQVFFLDYIVFLGGGISGCPDWQKEMIARFKHLDDKFVIANPRRPNFDITDPKASSFQIEWEFNHLQLADAVIFWFPYNTLCPITLYELGVYAQAGVPLFVGCHPAYQRKFDVEKQLSLLRPDVVVHDNWEPLVKSVEDWYNTECW